MIESKSELYKLFQYYLSFRQTRSLRGLTPRSYAQTTLSLIRPTQSAHDKKSQREKVKLANFSLTPLQGESLEK